MEITTDVKHVFSKWKLKKKSKSRNKLPKLKTEESLSSFKPKKTQNGFLLFLKHLVYLLKGCIGI